jgi:hypothetical protein
MHAQEIAAGAAAGGGAAVVAAGKAEGAAATATEAEAVVRAYFFSSKHILQCMKQYIPACCLSRAFMGASDVPGD